jgi:hypothetical protein
MDMRNPKYDARFYRSNVTVFFEIRARIAPLIICSLNYFSFPQNVLLFVFSINNPILTLFYLTINIWIKHAYFIPNVRNFTDYTKNSAVLKQCGRVEAVGTCVKLWIGSCRGKFG